MALTMLTESQNMQTIKRESWRLFDEISPRYDLLNRLLSFGQDIRWRQDMALHLPAKIDLEVLDVATGTADVLLELIHEYPRVKSA